MKVKPILLIVLCSIVCSSLLVQTPVNSNPFKKAKDAITKKPEKKDTKKDTAKDDKTKKEAVKEDTTKKETTKDDKNKTYKIGDIGPGGGIVFYDKKNYPFYDSSIPGDWQYLEVAPVSTEVKAQWGAHNAGKYEYGQGMNVGGLVESSTGALILHGDTKSNNQRILKELQELKETGKAAQVCANLKHGGYNDWMLPGTQELLEMYRNLKSEKNLGGFKDDCYWSATGGPNQLTNQPSRWTMVVNFKNGEVWNFERNQPTYVRAIRAF